MAKFPKRAKQKNKQNQGAENDIKIIKKVIYCMWITHFVMML
jgi:hypothetical protein